MPPLADSDFTVIRSWVGDDPTDDDLEERFERLGTVDLVIEETLRGQLSSMASASNPASLSLNDGTSVTYTENIRALRENLRRFEALGGTNKTKDLPNSVKIAKISRSPRTR